MICYGGIKMAIWQFSFIILPQEKVMKYSNNRIENATFSDFQEISWEGHGLSKSSLEKVSNVLKETQSWSDDIKQFGSLDGTCIQLFYDENILDGISIRIDLRTVTAELLKEVVSFIKENEAILITVEGILLEPEIENLIEVIKESASYNFVKDPEGFLSTLSE